MGRFQTEWLGPKLGRPGDVVSRIFNATMSTAKDLFRHVVRWLANLMLVVGSPSVLACASALAAQPRAPPLRGEGRIILLYSANHSLCGRLTASLNKAHISHPQAIYVSEARTGVFHKANGVACEGRLPERLGLCDASRMTCQRACGYRGGRMRLLKSPRANCSQ